MRIDKALWFLRFAKTRALAQAIVEAGHLRLNGRRVERAHQPVVVGDILTLPAGREVRVVEILALPPRRGPAAEARGCYRHLDGRRPFPIAAGLSTDAAIEDQQP